MLVVVGLYSLVYDGELMVGSSNQQETTTTQTGCADNPHEPNALPYATACQPNSGMFGTYPAIPFSIQLWRGSIDGITSADT